MTTRDRLHDLIDQLPEAGLEGAHRYLEALREAGGDTLLASLLLAPEDDEPETPEEAAAVAEAREAIARGEVYTLDEVKRELGL
jgi:hypothetical protein